MYWFIDIIAIIELSYWYAYVMGEGRLPVYQIHSILSVQPVYDIFIYDHYNCKNYLVEHINIAVNINVGCITPQVDWMCCKIGLTS